MRVEVTWAVADKCSCQLRVLFISYFKFPLGVIPEAKAAVLSEVSLTLVVRFSLVSPATLPKGSRHAVVKWQSPGRWLEAARPPQTCPTLHRISVKPGL